MYGLGRRGLLATGTGPRAPPIPGLPSGVGREGAHRVAASGRHAPGQGPWPGNPRPAVTASAGQCDWGPWAAPSGDPGTPRPPWAANPGVFPQPTFAIEN